MSDDRLAFVEQWGVGPVGWILEEPDGRCTSGPVAKGRIQGGKYDGQAVRDPLTVMWDPEGLRGMHDEAGGTTP